MGAPRTGIRRLYAVLWTYSRGKRAQLVWALALLGAAAAIRIAIPFFFGCAVNALQVRGRDGLVRASLYLVAMLGTAIGSWILHGPARILERRVALHAREQLSDDLFARLLALPLRWHEHHHSGETLHRMQLTTNALFQFAQTQFIHLQNLVSIIGPLIALVAVSAVTGSVAIVGYTAIALILFRFDRQMVRVVAEENKAERKYTATIVDSVANIGTVLTLRLQAPLRKLARERHEDLSRPLRRDFVLNEQKWAVIDLLNNALRVGLVALFAWLSYRATGEVLVGTAVMVHQYAQQLGSVISSMAATWTDLVRRQADIASADVIFDAIAEPPRTAQPIAWQTIAIENAVLRHPNGARGLDGTDLQLRRGARIALVGGSGAGKSTLLRMLAGLYPADQVRITVDGAASELTDLSSLAVLVPQEPEIFDADVRANLTLGVPRDDADITRVCELACLQPVLDGLPGGLAAEISERGANLSGGQRQRIALARGLLAARGSSIVFLDEPTSSIDPVTEARIYDGMLASLADACVVSAIHRLHLLTRFDTIVLLDAGRVVDTGTFDELLARQPMFQAMWQGYSAQRDLDVTRAA
ncbi:MAG: ABC transporter ATP-binding protein [Kofleriaceae bacterium]